MRQRRLVQSNIASDGGRGERDHLGERKRWGGGGRDFKSPAQFTFNSRCIHQMSNVHRTPMPRGKATIQTTSGSGSATPTDIENGPVMARPILGRTYTRFRVWRGSEGVRLIAVCKDKAVVRIVRVSQTATAPHMSWRRRRGGRSKLET